MLPKPAAGSQASGRRRARKPLLLLWHLVPLPVQLLPTLVASFPLASRTPSVTLPAPAPLKSTAAATVIMGGMISHAGAAPNAYVPRAATPPPQTTAVVTASATAAATAAATEAAAVTAEAPLTAAPPGAPSMAPTTASLARGGACLCQVYLVGGGALVLLTGWIPATTEAATLAGAVRRGGLEQLVLHPRLTGQASRPQCAVAMAATLAGAAPSARVSQWSRLGRRAPVPLRPLSPSPCQCGVPSQALRTRLPGVL